MPKTKTAFDLLMSYLGKREIKTGFSLRGEVDLCFKKNGVAFEDLHLKNIIRKDAKQKVIDALIDRSVDKIFRMAIGDDGASVADPDQAKVPTATQEGLFHEIYRKDIQSSSKGELQIRFIGEFKSIDIPETAWKDLTKKSINEVALIMGDGIAGGGDVVAPNTPDADESVFSLRMFKTTPFDPADYITVTIRWTVYIEE